LNEKALKGGEKDFDGVRMAWIKVKNVFSYGIVPGFLNIS
jgi:hypothetical protein